MQIIINPLRYKITKIQANEQRDKESRRNNIIIYKIPESNRDRQEDRNKEDISFCMQLFNNALQAGVVEEDVVKVFRDRIFWTVTYNTRHRDFCIF